MSRTVKKTLKDGRMNLRGWSVLVEFCGEPTEATVITHTRGDRWLVMSDDRRHRGVFRSADMMLIGTPETEDA